MRVVGLILAGGQGRRMGGRDKAFLMLGGRPLVGHVLARFAPQVEGVAISANGDASRFAPFAVPVLPDACGQMGEGPLAGVLAGLDWARAQGADMLATIPVDLPFLPRDLVARLCAAAAVQVPPGAAVALCGGRRHPTSALWPVAMRDGLASLFAAGERRMQVALSTAAEVRFDVADGGADPFENLNTPEDLVRAEARLAGEGAGKGALS
ncbi:MAG: molybdenum cofactor guanylyltransferase MobA [Paracoccaceae bacterium]